MRFVFSLLLLPIVGSGVTRAADVDFSHDIVPLLKKHCAACHLGEKKQGGFSMNTKSALEAGGESGKAIVAGKSVASELIRRVTSTDETERMPPEGERLSDQEVSLLKRWIDEGPKWEEGFTFAGRAYEPPLKPRRPELPASNNGRENPVDRIIDAYLEKSGQAIPETISDTEFARRVTLDLTGLLPEWDRARAVAADSYPEKRAELIRKLLADDVAYAEHWLTFWNDLLRNDYSGTGFITGGRKQITPWLYGALVRNMPYDQFVRELVAPTPASEGYIQGIQWRGNVSASQTREVQFAQSISQSFLGINMKCASCHDSFIDHWKVDQAYGLAAIYATAPVEVHRCEKPTGRMAQASWIFPELGQIDPQTTQPERLKQLAALMTHPDNGRLTRTIVNRLWYRLMGRGIVHPVDAMHTEPWSADLLDFLAVDFADHGYNLKHTLELICSSRAYQSRMAHSTGDTGGAGYVYRGPIARRLTAEQFVDTVWQLTGAAPMKFDAAVERRPILQGTEAPPARPLQAKWIWTTPSSAGAPAGETVTFRQVWNLKSLPKRAAAAITCDNSWQLFINAQLVSSDDNWETIETLALENYLKAGANEILIVGKNLGDGPNPAALLFEARATFADGSDVVLASDATWQWTAKLPSAKGKLTATADDWSQAAQVEESGIWSGRIDEPLNQLLSQAMSGELRMVRASLVKADDLMRALGRPNRDQIVSMRPDDLAALEAISLSNGQTLFNALEVGARRLVQTHGDDSEALAIGVFEFAFARPPTAEELSAAREFLGDKPTIPAVQDFLWAVVMQPEFLYVR